MKIAGGGIPLLSRGGESRRGSGGWGGAGQENQLLTNTTLKAARYRACAPRPSAPSTVASQHFIEGAATPPRLRRGVCVSLAVALLSAGALAAQQNFVPEEATIRNTQAAFASGRATCVQVVQAYLSRIEAYDHKGPVLNSIIAVNPKALETA